MDLDPARCYQAALARDPRFDGRFFAGVTTTGVYCRPICPVRPARAENVRWFACAAAAEAAGFRPCRRCRPEAAPGTPAWTGTAAVVSRALRLIGDGALAEGGVERLAARLGLGARQLRRLFDRHLGASPAAIARARRAHFARTLLDDTALPITAVALSAGFGSIRQFNHVMRGTFHRSPRELRRTRRPGADATGGIAVRLAYRPPLDWRALLDFLALRATPGVEVVEGDAYERTFELDGVRGTIALRPLAGAAALRMEIRPTAPRGLLTLVERARRLCDLDADPQAVAAHLGASAVLRARVRARPGLRVPGAWDGFELAVRAVLGQQVSVRGATTLAGRLARAFGTPVESGRSELSHLFPRPEALADADLAPIGLTRARAATLRALARAMARGELVLDAADGLDEVVARLRAVPGIGEWTAHYVAMRALGEPDAFPHADLGLRRALGNGAGPLSAAGVLAAAEAWRPWRAYAAVHLWTGGRST